MLNNTLTVGAFGLRLASQAILLLCAYVWLDPASYQFLLLLSFFASFLSLSDFGFAQLIVKKLDFALQQPKAKVGSLLRKIVQTSLIPISLGISISIAFTIVVSRLDRGDELVELILIYTMLYLVNYGFTLGINACLGLSRATEARVFEIFKHLLLIVVSVLSLYFLRDINLLIISQTFAGFGMLVAVCGYIFAKASRQLEAVSPRDQATPIIVAGDFLRSSLGEIIFKSALLFATWSLSSTIQLEEANIILTGIKLMDVVSVLVINFAYVNLRRFRDVKLFMPNWLFMNFSLISMYILIIFCIILVPRLMWSISVHQHLSLLFLAAWFFIAWRASNFAEFMTNLADHYWQFKHYLRAICGAGIICLIGYLWQGLNAQTVLAAVALAVSITVLPEAVWQLKRFRLLHET